MTTANFPTPDPTDRQFTPQGYCLDSGHDCSEHPMPDMRPLTARGPMPTVEYDGKTYKLRSRKVEVPDLAAMNRFAALTWLINNTRPRGYSRANNPLAGYGGILEVR